MVCLQCYLHLSAARGWPVSAILTDTSGDNILCYCCLSRILHCFLHTEGALDVLSIRRISLFLLVQDIPPPRSKWNSDKQKAIVGYTGAREAIQRLYVGE